jgi:hypothetical protein
MRKLLPGVLAVLGVAASVVLAAFLVTHWPPWDPRMPGSEVEAALAKKFEAERPGFPGRVHFDCDRLENDGTIEMDDVDYDCDEVVVCPKSLSGRRLRTCRDLAGASIGFWVDTNRHEITETMAYF